MADITNRNKDYRKAAERQEREKRLQEQAKAKRDALRNGPIGPESIGIPETQPKDQSDTSESASNFDFQRKKQDDKSKDKEKRETTAKETPAETKSDRIGADENSNISKAEKGAEETGEAGTKASSSATKAGTTAEKGAAEAGEAGAKAASAGAKTGSKFAPGFGEAIGAADTLGKASQGDIEGAGKSAVDTVGGAAGGVAGGAIGSAVPGVGTAIGASVGSFVGSFLSDIIELIKKAQIVIVGLMIGILVAAYIFGFWIASSLAEGMGGGSIIDRVTYDLRMKEIFLLLSTKQTDIAKEKIEKILTDAMDQSKYKVDQAAKDALKTGGDQLLNATQKADIEKNKEELKKEIDTLADREKKYIAVNTIKYQNRTAANFTETTDLKAQVIAQKTAVQASETKYYQKLNESCIAGTDIKPNSSNRVAISQNINRVYASQSAKDAGSSANNYVTPKAYCVINYLNNQYPNSIYIGDASPETGLAIDHTDLFQDGKDFQLLARCAIMDEKYQMGCAYNRDTARQLLNQLKQLGATYIIGPDKELSNEGLMTYNPNYIAWVVHIES